MKRSSAVTCGITLGRLLALVVLVGFVGGMQPIPAEAQKWEPEISAQARLQELATTYEQWLQDHRPTAYYDIINGIDPRSALLADPSVTLDYIEDGRPFWVETNNVISAQTISTDEVWPGGSSGYNLNGAGTTGAQLGIWEAGANGAVRTTHEALTGRVTQVDSSGFSNHATHVAGTMVAAGPDATAQGMSFQASMNAYTSANDTPEMTAAAAAGMMVSNHSYGSIAGWRGGNWWGDIAINQNEDWIFGFYNSKAQQWDQLAVNAPNYLIVMAAGNDRDDAAPAAGTPHLHGSAGPTFTDTHNSDGAPNGYDSIPTNGCAKNILTIGAVIGIPGGYTAVGDVVQSAFSGWGPTDDGRIKPDIVTDGVNVWSTGANADDHYYFNGGTSMASPAASGSANLLRGQFQTLNGAPPRSATLKALIINTADEAGPANGPDYMNGWGLMNTQSAADIIAAGPFDDRGIIEDDLANGGTDTYNLNVNNPGDVRVTIVWTDPAGTPPAASLDPTNLMLVNDLDLRVQHVSSAVTTMPWVLNPASPANAATTGDNTRDNVERIDIAGAPLGAYQVTVSHKGTLTGSPQQYSLIFSGMSVNAAPVAICQNVTKAADANCLAEVTPAEVDNGSFDPDGDPITLSLSPSGPYGLGVTNVTLTVTDDKGASSTCTAMITVEDVTPPDVTCPADVTVECSVAGGVPADDPQLAAFFAGFSVVDNCDANPTVINDAPALFDGPCAASGGVTVVTWTATDASGNSAQCSATVTVIDTTQPELSVTLNRETLWPPNHKMADINATVEVTDICDPTPTFVLTSVTSDEPDNARGVGDGNTVNDIQGVDLGTDDVEFQLRSERQGGGDGRTYTIVYTATDCSGNATEEEVYVTVPHDQGGSASPAAGFTADGRNFEPGNSGFTIVVQNPSKTRDVDPSTAYVGNLRGYIAPVAHLWADLNGDSLEELVLHYEMAPALELRFGTVDIEVSGGLVSDLSEGRKNVDEGLALRYETQSGGYLLGSIFGMGSKIVIQPGNGDEDPLGENRLPQSGYDVPVVEEAVVDVFSVTGRKIRTLIFNGVAGDLGELRWDGKDSSGRQVPNGMYFYRIRSAQTVYTKKIMLVR